MIALDTNIFIYVLESDPVFGLRAASILRRAQNQGSASLLVYLELLSKPQLKDLHAAAVVRSFLDEQALEYILLDKELLVKAAELRASMSPKIGIGDALHVASALRAGAHTFITNDQDLVKLKIPSIKIVGL